MREPVTDDTTVRLVSVPTSGTAGDREAEVWRGSFAQFALDNSLDEIEVRDVRNRLSKSGAAVFGGGAGPVYVLERAATEPVYSLFALTHTGAHRFTKRDDGAPITRLDAFMGVHQIAGHCGNAAMLILRDGEPIWYASTLPVGPLDIRSTTRVISTMLHRQSNRPAA